MDFYLVQHAKVKCIGKFDHQTHARDTLQAYTPELLKEPYIIVNQSQLTKMIIEAKYALKRTKKYPG